jgi:predicted ester cyclase
LLLPDAVAHGIVAPDGTPVTGPATFKPFYRQFRTAFPDIHIAIEDTLAEGDRICARCLVTATHSGHGVAGAPTNRAVRFTGMCIIRFHNGRIAEAWNNFDFLAMYQQLGMQLS